MVIYLKGGRSKKAKLKLSPSDYQIAIEAHAARKDVRFEGIAIDPEKPTVEFTEVMSFEAVEQ